MNKNLLILGAGGYGSVVKEIALESGFFEKIDFLDDSFGVKNTQFHEESVGTIKEYENLAGTYTYAIAAIGNPDVRADLTEKLLEKRYIIPVLISARAYVSPSAQIRQGSVIEPNATVMPNTVVETGTYISAGAIINHNAHVGEFSHVDCNATVMSGAYISPKSLVEANSVARRTPMQFEIGKDGITAAPISEK